MGPSASNLTSGVGGSSPSNEEGRLSYFPMIPHPTQVVCLEQ